MSADLHEQATLALKLVNEARAQLEDTLLTGICTHPLIFHRVIMRIPVCRLCGESYPEERCVTL